ncbi:MAG: type II toxin-antitoxin system death-on-curing family toxin [Planctomycetes bacterium]|nr:type II toxin-antitoxin system death-on-curing family toxin [Planctomycetota bacterium]
MNWLNLDELVLIHEQVIAETGGSHGVLHPGALESALGRPFVSFAGAELFPTLFDKVAALIHAITSFHPFADGNKRTALVAGDVCLRLNGFRLRPSEEVEPFFWAIARGEADIEGIAAWLGAHTEPWREE